MTDGPEVLRADAELPAYRLAGWEAEHPGLRAGVTAGSRAGDLGLDAARPPAEWAERMTGAAESLGGRGVAVARQVHGRRVVEVSGRPRGVLVPGEADGLITDERGTLLAVTVADCVPVFLLDPGAGALALLHAGWRGAAAGVLAAGVEALEERYGSPPGRLLCHLGPAICGDCYEVGPEVPRALGATGADVPSHVDLRAELAGRAADLGVGPGRTSSSPVCTRCGADHLFSHRGTGTAKRMAAFLGWRAAGDAA